MSLSPRVERAAVRSFALLSAVSFLVFLGSGLAFPLMSLRMRELGATYADIGLLQAILQVVAVGSLYFWGSRSDRLGRRKPIALLGLAGMALSYFLLYQVDSLAQLFAVRIFESLSVSAYTVSSLTLIGDLLERNRVRGSLMAAWRTAGSVAYSVAAFFTGGLADSLGLRVPFLLASASYLLAFLCLALLAEAKSSPSQDQVAVATAGHARSLARQFLPFLLVSFAFSALLSASEPLLPVYLVERGIELAVATRLIAVGSLTEVPFMLLGGTLADRVGRRVLVTLAFAAAGATLMLWAWAPVLPWVIGMMALWGAGFGVFTAAAMLYATEMTGRQGRGRSVGLYNLASRGGSLVGAALGGGLSQLLGISSMLAIGGILALALGILAARYLPESREARAGDQAVGEGKVVEVG